MKTGAVILAGGYSSRMDGFKPLMKLGGKSLLEHSVRLFKGTPVSKIVVVTGYQKSEVKAEAARLDTSVVFNKKYDSGMFSSLRVGVKEMKKFDNFFILPVDIPLIRPATVTSLCKKFLRGGIVYPAFFGQRGYPPLLSSKLIPALLDAKDECELPLLLAKFPTSDVAVWDEGILFDTNTSDDFVRLRERFLLMRAGSSKEVRALAEQTMSPQGLSHGLAVAEIARILGDELNSRGCKLDMRIIVNSALLHDIAKGQPRHELCGAKLVKSLGLHDLSACIGAHKNNTFDEKRGLTEKDVVCLADKMVRGTRFMPATQLFEEKLQLYKGNKEASKLIRGRLANILKLENRVVDILGKPLEEILPLTPAEEEVGALKPQES